jgi:hypothetical protein
MTQVSQKQKSIWSIFFLTVIFFLALATLLEMLARTSWLERISPFRSVGNFDYQFEIKWFRLQDYVKRHGGVDIILLGSSLVNTGIDPDVMAQVYYEQTGIQLRIFNFGLEGLTVAPNSVNARILVNKYHPALLIYVTSMRDYLVTNGLDYERSFLSSPWIKYQQGDFDPTGWLIDHSMALQHYLPYRNWMRADFPKSMSSYLYRYKNTSFNGYEPELAMGKNVDIPPNPNDPAEAVNFQANASYQVAPSRLKNLQSILFLKKEKGSTVLIVEMPFHPTFYVYVGGDAVHRQFQKTISSIVGSNGGLFIPAEKCNDIPLVGRANRWHLNYLGAPVFSTCLGQHLVILAEQQNNHFINLNANRSK